MADYLIEVCQRRGVGIKVVGEDLEIEFDGGNAPHDLSTIFDCTKLTSFAGCEANRRKSRAIGIRSGRCCRQAGLTAATGGLSWVDYLRGRERFKAKKPAVADRALVHPHRSSLTAVHRGHALAVVLFAPCNS
jgi:hypothetical protein